MKMLDLAYYSYIGLKQRQGRFWLTIIGIVIGIASVVALLTIGEGFNAEVNRQLSSLNGNTIYILPIAESQLQGGSFGSISTTPFTGKLTEKDVERLKKIPEITAISRLSERRATLEYKGKRLTAAVSGYEPGVFEQIATLDIGEGRTIGESDRGVVLMGA
ncbi:MAG: ABC transporter permease, partial [Candidatus Micrarchaeota archaeon]|nr:ABC transporter permease [Candidatus Micrarchaeota archaeon]